MKNLFQTKLFRTKILPAGIIIVFLIFAGTIAYIFAPKQNIESASIKNVQTKKDIVPIQSKQILSTQTSVLGSNTYQPSQTEKVNIELTSSQKNTPTITQQVNAQNTTISSIKNTNTQVIHTQDTVPSIAMITPTLSEEPIVSVTVSPTVTIHLVLLQIQTPDGTGNFSIILKDGANVCDILQEAKDEGKINSVTFDDSYMSSLHSTYVNEINGYKNNWTFAVNGSSPLGCSLFNPKPNDSIVWKFG